MNNHNFEAFSDSNVYLSRKHSVTQPETTKLHTFASLFASLAPTLLRRRVLVFSAFSLPYMTFLKILKFTEDHGKFKFENVSTCYKTKNPVRRKWLTPV